MKKNFSERDIDRIIEMAWEDRTPFEAITYQFGISEQETIELMRKEMKRSSFKMWRKRVQGRSTKHAKLRDSDVNRFKCKMQRQITGNKISKR
ncbi:MAG: TIGR03643 family protein [Bacteroidota bacterium]